jgi:hypothetical protein
MDSEKVHKQRKKSKATKTKSKNRSALPNISQHLSAFTPAPKRIQLKKQKEKPTTVKYEKTYFRFKRNKTTGTYSIYNYKGKRISTKSSDMFLPFGLETFNNSEIMNVYFKVLDNFHHNFLVRMREFDERLRNLPQTNTDLDLTDLEYQPIIKENHFINAEDNEDMRYFFRCHLTAGVNIRHKSYFGNYDKKNLTGKRCNIQFDLGSLWISRENGTYGATIYITDMIVHN